MSIIGAKSFLPFSQQTFRRKRYYTDSDIMDAWTRSENYQKTHFFSVLFLTSTLYWPD